MNGTFGNLWKIVFLVSGAVLVVLGLVLCGYGASKVVDYNQLLEEAFDKDDEDDDGGVGDGSDEDDELKDSITVDIPAAVIAGAGLLSVLFVLLGCCGVVKESRIVLGVYIPLMVVIFICLGVCIVIVYVSESQELRDRITDNIDFYDPDSGSSKSEAATKAVDAVQKSLKCCGLDSYEEWGENSYLQAKSLRVPESCCHADGLADDVDACTKDPDGKAELFVSCNEALNPFGKEVGIIAIVMVAIMVLNLVSSCIVCAMVD